MIDINNDKKTAYFTSTLQIDRIKLNNTYHYITNVQYSDNCYQDGNVFGTAEARQLEFEIENSVNVEKSEYEYQTGIEVNGEINWISLGNFITYDVEEDDVTGVTKVVAMDNMIKSNVLYDHTSLDYSLGPTIKEILEDALEQCNLELGTETFVNSSFRVYSDQFEDNALIRQVIIACAQISGTFAKIRSDNKLYLINPNKLIEGSLADEDNIDIVTEDDKLVLLEKKVDIESGSQTSGVDLVLKDYSDNTTKRNTHEINTLILGMANVEGENVTVRDEDMIAQDGTENKIVINDNPFAYTQDLRTQLINPIFNSIKGFSYTAYELKYQGLPYLECGDRVTIKTVQGRVIESYCFRYTFKSPNGLDSELQAPSLTDAEVKYENIENLDTRLKRTEIIVDKENQTITSIVEQIGDRSGKSTTITQDIDGIESIVEETIDITRETEDTDPLTLTNALKGDLLELHIYGNNEVFDYLYPEDDLYPSDILYPYGDSRIHIWTNNVCPDGIDNWENGFINGANGTIAHSDPFNDAMMTSDYIKISTSNIYIFFESQDYKIWGVAFYDSSKTYISKSLKRISETAITCPTSTAYIKYEVVKSDFHYQDTGYENNYPSIIPADIIEAKPMVVYGTEREEYCGYNDIIIDLGVTEVLRRFEKSDGTIIRDSFDLVNNNATITRRVGVDSGGNLYDLVTPVVTDLGEMKIPLAEGDNYFEIVNYNATCKARWVIRNVYTDTFASTVELESSITQLANSINLQVSKKVNNNEIIARINMAILNRDEAEIPEDIETSIIEILANKIQITSDYFEITRYGEATFRKGYIGNWVLNNGFLFSNHYEGSTLYQSGLHSLNTDTGTTVFLYAGADITGGSTSLTNSNFYVTNAGLCKAKWFEVNGESGYFYVNYNSGRRALQFSRYGIYWKLDNANNNNYCNLAVNANNITLTLDDCPGFVIYDEIHNESLFSVNRYRPEAGFNQSAIYLWAKTTYFAGGSTGYEIATKNDICDETVKKNIKDSKESALSKIERIEFKQFDWDKNKIDKEGHIDIGITAQQVKEVDENFVEKTIIQKTENIKGGKEKITEQELYTINTLNMVTTAMKAIQELNEIVKEQQKQIDNLKDEINKLKGENK